jgi:hypothetical protein
MIVLRKHVFAMWMANTVILILVLIASLGSDANGRLPGLDETSSILMVASLIGVGLVMDMLAGWYDRKRWLLCLAVGAVYVVMIVPLTGLV